MVICHCESSTLAASLLDDSVQVNAKTVESKATKISYMHWLLLYLASSTRWSSLRRNQKNMTKAWTKRICCPLLRKFPKVYRTYFSRSNERTGAKELLFNLSLLIMQYIKKIYLFPLIHKLLWSPMISKDHGLLPEQAESLLFLQII